MSEALDRVYRTPAILLAAELTENEAAISRLTAERDEAREQARSLTVERDALLALPTGIGRFIRSAAKANAEAAGLRARLSRAREALHLIDYPGGRAAQLVGGIAQRIAEAKEEGWAALRAALSEPPAGS